MTTDLQAAERAVIGAALIDPNSVRFSAEHVIPDDFEDTILGHMFSLIVGLKSAGLPVDPISMEKEARERGLRGITGLAIHDLMSGTPTASNVEYYARAVHEGAIRRRLSAFGVRAVQLSEAGTDLTELMNQARVEWETVKGAVAAKLESKTLAQILEGTDDYDWVIPGLIERKDRVILTGGEGSGKSTMVRQIAILASAGLHPITFQQIPPVKVLVVDAENTPTQWRRNARPIAIKARQQGTQDPAQHLQVACVPRIDISTERDLGAIHRLVDEHQPDILIIGPLYRLIPRAINSDDDAAPLLTALDSLRDRGMALVMEAHAGHAKNQGGDRDLRPRGSSALLGWPEFGFGLTLDRDDERLAHLVRWRGDRDEREWPASLRRGGEWPWTDERRATNPGWQPHKGHQ